jgi:hypothetical protein
VHVILQQHDAPDATPPMAFALRIKLPNIHAMVGGACMRGGGARCGGGRGGRLG